MDRQTARRIAEQIPPERWAEIVATIRDLCAWYDRFVEQMTADAEAHANGDRTR